MNSNNAASFKALRAPNPPEFKHTRQVESPYPKGLPGDFAASYAQSETDRARSKPNRPMSKGRRIAIGLGTSALIAATAGAVRSADTQNHNAAVAAGLLAPASTDAQNLANGSKAGVAIVTEPVGVSEREAARGIANSSSILQVQGLINAENGSTTTQQSEVALPINDLNQKTLGTLPNGAKVTIPELTALETGATLAQVEQAHNGN